jgi:hypothetical protein
MLRKFGLTFVLLLSACSSSSGPSGLSPDEGMTAVSQALSSAAAASGDELTRLSARGYSITLDPKCSEHAEPLDSNGDLLNEGDSGYTGSLFYCLMKQPGGGPDTLQGAIEQATSMLCMLKDKLNFNGEPETVTVTLDDSCFPDSSIEELGGPLSMEGTVTTSELGSPLFGNASEWDYSIEIDASPDGIGDVNLRILVKSDENVFAASMHDQVSGHENDGFSVFLDLANGVLRYESKHQRYGEDCGDSSCGWNRHNRFLVEGTLDTDGTFTEVADIQAIHTNIYEMSPSDFFSLESIKGNPTDGFYTHRLTGNGDPADFAAFASGSDECVSGSCDGNTGIEFASTDDLDFLMYPTGPNFTETTDWFEALAPLSFSSVTTADTQ